MTRARRIDELIARSSLGTDGAVELRRKTPEVVGRALVRRSNEWRGVLELNVHMRKRERTKERRTKVASKSNRHVVPNHDGGWDVRKPGGERASSHHQTQADAERRAREIVRNLGGGEVRTHGRDGRIRDSDTVPKGNDPNPPRDRR